MPSPKNELVPYLEQLDHIVNDYLDYEFDTPGKENQSFKEFMDWLKNEEQKILPPEFFKAGANRLRYSLLRPVITLKLVIKSRSNVMNLFFRNFKTEKTKAKTLIHFRRWDPIEVSFYPSNEKLSWESKIAKTYIIQRLLQNFSSVIASPVYYYDSIGTLRTVNKYIHGWEVRDKIVKVKLERIFDAQPVIEFIIRVNELIDSINSDKWINNLTILERENRSMRLTKIFRKYLTDYEQISTRNYDFIDELLPLE